MYLEIPLQVLRSTSSEKIEFPPLTAPAYPSQADPKSITDAVELLAEASCPLVVIGDGAAYAKAEEEVRQFIELTKIPFLPMSMAKGVVPDAHPLCAAAAREFVIHNADVVLLLRACLDTTANVALEKSLFARRDVKFIHVDIHGEYVGDNVPVEVALLGNVKMVMSQLNDALEV